MIGAEKKLVGTKVSATNYIQQKRSQINLAELIPMTTYTICSHLQHEHTKFMENDIKDRLRICQIIKTNARACIFRS